MDADLRRKVQLAKPAHFLAFGFGSGLAPTAPGTFGSLAAIPLVWALGQTSVAVYLSITLVCCLVGIWLCQVAADDMGVHDHPAIVWDEVAGMLVTFIAIAPTSANLLVGFLLFRLFDIAKPWPIKWLDQKVEGGVGIMLDDLVAGIFACLSLWLINSQGWIS